MYNNKMEYFNESFDWQYYSTENKTLNILDRENAWKHANLKGWKDKKRIYQNLNVNEEFMSFKCNEHFENSLRNIKLNDVKINFTRQNRYSEYNDLYNYSIELHHEGKKSIMNNYTDKIYCINLIDNDNKLISFLKMANKYRIDCCIMRMTKLINSEKFMNKFLNLKPPKPDDWISHKLPGELGCTMSHLICLLDAIYHKFSRIIIFEDDVIPIKNINEEFKKITHILSNYSYVYLGASQHKWFKEISIKPYHYTSFQTMGSFALYIHHDIMEFLILEYEKMNRKIDKVPWLFYENKTSIFYQKSAVIYPNLFIADVSESDIRGKREMKTHSKKLRWELSKYDITN